MPVCGDPTYCELEAAVVSYRQTLAHILGILRNEQPCLQTVAQIRDLCLKGLKS